MTKRDLSDLRPWKISEGRNVREFPLSWKVKTIQTIQIIKYDKNGGKVFLVEQGQKRYLKEGLKEDLSWDIKTSKERWKTQIRRRKEDK